MVISEKRKQYNRVYYLTKIKPFRLKKQPTTYKRMFKCPFCSAVRYPQDFEKLHDVQILGKFYLGRSNIMHKDIKNDHPFFSAQLKDFIRNLVNHAKSFIRLYGDDLDVLEVERLWQIQKLKRAKDLINGGNVLNGGTCLTEPRFLGSAKKLVAVTLSSPKRLKKSSVQ